MTSTQEHIEGTVAIVGRLVMRGVEDPLGQAGVRWASGEVRELRSNS